MNGKFEKTVLGLLQTVLERMDFLERKIQPKEIVSRRSREDGHRKMWSADSASVFASSTI